VARQGRKQREPDRVAGSLRRADRGVAGEVLPLPRCAQGILEDLACSRGCRATKAQIFNSSVGSREDIDEYVIESHMSKLRTRLPNRAGLDPNQA
jgi:DNA-binding response OmpR family regulator